MVYTYWTPTHTTLEPHVSLKCPIQKIFFGASDIIMTRLQHNVNKDKYNDFLKIHKFIV